MNIDLKVCGITSASSIKIAAENKIKSLDFASDNLPGPNTCNDDKIRSLINECDYYKIESVLLTRHHSLQELIEQIDYTKPKTISCSYFFLKEDLLYLKSVYKKLKIGIALNPKKFDDCNKIILPGVGAFDSAVRSLKDLDLFDSLINLLVYLTLNLFLKCKLVPLNPVPHNNFLKHAYH